jgi:hypothetical protein
VACGPAENILQAALTCNAPPGPFHALSGLWSFQVSTNLGLLAPATHRGWDWRQPVIGRCWLTLLAQETKIEVEAVTTFSSFRSPELSQFI